MPSVLQPDSGSLITYGGAVKALGGGKVGGYLVTFGSADQTDTSDLRDYFTAKTDFAAEFPAATAVYYNHGLDANLGRRRLADGAKMRQDEVGVWVEAQLKLRDEWERAVYGLAEAGKLSWSSGTAHHLVERAAIKSGGETVAHEITAWPLGLDASLTPTPAEPRCEAMALKSVEMGSLKDLIGTTDACLDCGSSRSLAEATESVIRSVTDLAADYNRLATKEGRVLSASRHSRLKDLLESFQAFVAETEPRPRDADAPAAVMEAPANVVAEAEPADATLSPQLWLPSADLNWIREG